MSLWNPLKSGDHAGIRRIWNHYGMPTVVADVIHMINLDGFDFIVFAGATYAPGEPPHTASAKAKDMASAKVIGSALAKMVRNNCIRAARTKAAKRAKANMALAISIAEGGAK